MPRDRRLDGRVLEVQLGLRDSVAFACCDARGSPAAARARVAATCSGPVCAVLQPGLRLLLAGPRLRRACSRPRGCPLRLRRPATSRNRLPPAALRPRPTPRRTAAATLRPWRAARAAARRRAPPWPRSLPPRAAAPAPSSAARAPPRSLFLRRRSPLCACVDASLCAVVTLLDAVGRRDRHAALRGDRRSLRRRPARRARLIDAPPGSRADRARRARSPASTCWLSSTCDVQHRAADARRNLRHVRIDLRIVGRFAAGREPQPDDDADDDKNRRSPTPIRTRGLRVSEHGFT